MSNLIQKQGLQHKTATGIFWQFLELTGRRGIGVFVTIILARFLAPEAYGLIAMVSVFYAIANAIMEAGFRQALIRKKDATPLDYSTMFYTNIVLGLMAYCLLFLAAPHIASFYGEDKLIIITRVVGVVVIINSLQFVQIVDLTRKLDFKTQFKAVLPAGLISGTIAILMAIKGFGVWSLVAQMILSPLLITLYLWKINTWRPTLQFSMDSFRDMFSFGSKLFLSGLLARIFKDLYIVVIGKFFSPVVTGYYFFATKVRDIILQQFCESIQKVTYPALSSIQDENERLKRAYRKVILAMTYLIFPSMIFLIVLAHPLFATFLKDKWIPAVPYLQLLCIAGLVYPLHVVNLSLLKVKGRSDLFLYLELVKKIMTIFVLIISIRFGIWGVLVGQIITSFVAYAPNSYFTARLIGYPVIEQLKDVFPALVLSVLAGIAMLLLNSLNMIIEIPIIVLLIQILAGIAIYIGTALMLKLEIQNVIWIMCKDRFAHLLCKQL